MSLNPKYILDGPLFETSEEVLSREVPGEHRVQNYRARVQYFELKYYSDYMDDEDEPFPGALMDSDANELARDLLDQFVADNRLPQIGKFVYDDHVDGAETVAQYAEHENEFTIYYQIIEDTGFRVNFDNPHKKSPQSGQREHVDGYTRRINERTLLSPGTLAEFVADVGYARKQR